MEKFVFQNFKNVLTSIKKENYSKIFAETLSDAYYVGDDEFFDNFIFENDLLEQDVFFNFIAIGVGFEEVSQEKFIEIIDELLLLNDYSHENIAKILFKDKLEILKEKIEKGVISKGIYQQQIDNTSLKSIIIS